MGNEQEIARTHEFFDIDELVSRAGEATVRGYIDVFRFIARHSNVSTRHRSPSLDECSLIIFWGRAFPKNWDNESSNFSLSLVPQTTTR